MTRISLLLIVGLAACAPLEAPGSGTTAGGRSATVRPEVNNGAGYEFLINRDAISTHTLAIPGDRLEVWDALRRAFATLKIPNAVADSTSFEIGSRELVIRGRLADRPLSVLLDCGRIVGGPIANIYRVRMSVVSALHQGEGAWSRLVTTMEAIASDPTAGGSGVRCTSTGELERRIAALTAVGIER